jgi:hypothetical protein
MLLAEHRGFPASLSGLFQREAGPIGSGVCGASAAIRPTDLNVSDLVVFAQAEGQCARGLRKVTAACVHLGGLRRAVVKSVIVTRAPMAVGFPCRPCRRRFNIRFDFDPRFSNDMGLPSLIATTKSGQPSSFRSVTANPLASPGTTRPLSFGQTGVKWPSPLPRSSRL